MMHVYYCLKCKRYRYTNTKKNTQCCDQSMYLVDIDFTDFVKMDLEERQRYLQIYALAE